MRTCGREARGRGRGRGRLGTPLDRSMRHDMVPKACCFVKNATPFLRNQKVKVPTIHRGSFGREIVFAYSNVG